MAEKFVSMKNLKFMLEDVFKVEELTKFDYFKDHNNKTFNMVLDAALKIGTKLLNPIFEEMDRKPPELVNGVVKVHPDVKKILKEFGENGWIGANFPYEEHGEQLPLTVASCAGFIFAAANYSGSVYSGLSMGAAKLILSFGSKELQDAYVKNMLGGKWQGTMALTEPSAGSSLADITTTAIPNGDGTYRLKGQKIFISAGDHDGVENVVHLTLGKVQGAPAGVKGISLFVVPKLRITGKGLESNDVTVTQVFHKMGYRGAPITELSFGEKDDCVAYLLGEENKGLSYMFQMMNEARIGVGLGATAIASAAYYAALNYAKTRTQGRNVAGKDPSSPQIPIIQHADVKRMLLHQRSIVEGALSLILQCSIYEDRRHVSDGEDKENNFLLLDLLTPVAKSYPSEMGIDAVSKSIQIFGGYGYCEDFPVEQHFRDMRIHPIHEGTTGIQGMDLLGRKLIMKNGKAFFLYLEEVRKSIKEASAFDELKPLSEKLENALKKLEEVSSHLMVLAQTKGPDIFLADAVLFLDFFGTIAISWQWLKQATAVKSLPEKRFKKSENFYSGKIYACRYFFAYELPKTEGLAKRLMDNDPFTVDMETNYFAD